MKVCRICGDEISTRDGDNECQSCEDWADEANRAKRRKANQRRRERDQVMQDLGLVKVRGALGGTYWE